MTTTFIDCQACGADVHPLEVFPHSLCLRCHIEATKDDEPMTAERLTAMWGGTC